MRKFVLSIIVLLVASWMMIGFSYSEELCDACYEPPEKIQEYLDIISEIIFSLTPRGRPGLGSGYDIYDGYDYPDYPGYNSDEYYGNEEYEEIYHNPDYGDIVEEVDRQNRNRSRTVIDGNDGEYEEIYRNPDYRGDGGERGGYNYPEDGEDIVDDIGSNAGDLVDRVTSDAKRLLDTTQQSMIDIYKTTESEAMLNLGMPFFSSLGSDMLSSFRIIFKPYPVVRDRKQLMELDEMLSNKVVRIGNRYAWDEPIDEPTRIKLEMLLSELEFIRKIDIQRGVSNGDVMGFLWRLHTLYKNMFLYGINMYFSESDILDYREFITDEYSDKFVFQSSLNVDIVEYVKDLELEYKCVISPETEHKICPEGSWEQFKENIIDIVNIEDDWYYIMEKYETSFKRLKAVLRDVGFIGDIDEQSRIDYEMRKQDLLSDFYGTDEFIDHMNKESMWGLGNLWRNVKTESEEVMKSFNNNLVDPLARIGYSAQHGLDFYDKVGIENIKSDLDISYEKDRVKSRFADGMSTTFYGVLDSEGKYVKDTTLHEPNGVTLLIPDLTKRIVYGKGIVGDSQDDEYDNTIIRNMGEACERQCTNVGWKCYDDGM